jgi:hypothetical protein
VAVLRNRNGTVVSAFTDGGSLDGALVSCDTGIPDAPHPSRSHPPVSADGHTIPSTPSKGNPMKRLLMTAGAVLALLAAAGSPASADPASSRNTLTLHETCSNGQTYTLVSPASGHAVLDLGSTQVQITRQLTVVDPLGELGGSFTVPLQPGFTLDQLTYCTGTVAGTSVTFTAYVQLTGR